MMPEIILRIIEQLANNRCRLRPAMLLNKVWKRVSVAQLWA
jgi:hypothetical protein